jgi:hypothetical protein
VSALFVWLLIAGGVPAAILGEIVQAESPRIARAGRIAFALLLGADLLLAAVAFSVGNYDGSVLSGHATRSIWWLTAIAGGVPLALVSGLAVRRGYTGNRLALAAATLTTAVLYFAFPLGFIPATHPLTGLGRFEHDHHVLGIAILLIPSLILLANELRWREEAAPDPEAGRLNRRSRSRVMPRRNVIVGGVLLLLVLIWAAGTNSYGMLVGFGVVFAGCALFLWHRNRVIMRSVRRDLRSPEKP